MQCTSFVLSSALLSSNVSLAKMPTDDEDECEEENESRTTTAPSGLRNRTRSRHRRQSRMIRMREVQSAKRALFQDKHQIDSQTNLDLVQKEFEAILDSSTHRWDFDFRTGKPLRSDNARYIWEPINLSANKSRINDSIKVQKESQLNNNTITTTTTTSTSNCDLKCRVNNKKRQLTITDYFKVSKRQKSNNNEEKTTTTTTKMTTLDDKFQLANTLS